MEQKRCNDLARIISKVGEILIESGAETYRVEDTMIRIAKAYGASIIDAYATPTLLIISFTLDDELVHNIKRVNLKTVDLAIVDKVNTLSRKVVLEKMDLELLNEELDKIRSSNKNSLIINLFAASICCFGFAFFFHGDIFDALSSAFLATIIYLLNRFLKSLAISDFINNIISACLLTFLANLFFRFGFIHDQHIVIIAVLMLLVPGLAFTNAIRDTVNGDLTSGVTRGIEAIFVAIALAIGSGLAYILGGFYV